MTSLFSHTQMNLLQPGEGMDGAATRERKGCAHHSDDNRSNVIDANNEMK